MQTQTVRIAEKDHAALNEMSRETGKPMSAILSEAIQELRRSQLLRETNDAYARLRQKPKAWQEEVEERAIWDNTLADGTE
jgi:hypothetical protein